MGGKARLRRGTDTARDAASLLAAGAVAAKAAAVACRTDFGP